MKKFSPASFFIIVPFFLVPFFVASIFIPRAHAQTAPVTSAATSSAADNSSVVQTVYKAQVLEIESQQKENLAGLGENGVTAGAASTTTSNLSGSGLSTNDQTLDVKILDGDEAGKELTVDNDYVMMKPGDVFYLIHTSDPSDPQSLTDGSDYYTVSDPYRLPALGILLGIFILCVIVFGGAQGIRGLASLAGGLSLILFVLLPGILHGWSPILVSIGVSSLIILVGSYITHGFNRTTSAAVVGMIVTVIITGALAYFAVGYTQLSGFSNEEAVYLNSAVSGGIDMAGLLLGGIMIGLLGVLYDIAISQAVAIEELHTIAPHVPWRHIYRRAIRIGREHIGALVNTLAIAYVGVSLPLLLLLYLSAGTSPVAATVSVPGGWQFIVNQEIFATEIVRILVGSIGLVLAVPIVTLVAIMMLIQRGDKKNFDGKAATDRGLGTASINPQIIAEEERALEYQEHAGHYH